MLNWLTDMLLQVDPGFGVFQYLTLRTVFSAVTALLLSLLLGQTVIRYLHRLQVKQVVREDGPHSHLAKSGTPTMGGLLILGVFVLTALLWARLENVYVWTVVLATLFFGLIGFVDDYLKVVRGNSRGLRARWKFLAQSVAALVIGGFLYTSAAGLEQTALYVPVFKEVALNLGPAYLLLAYFVIVGSSNAVNLTDGLDGLAILPCAMIAAALGLLAYVAGHSEMSAYFSVPYVEGAGELAIVCGAISGAALGFLWFNAYPAQVFMGDVGALALGAALGVLALISRHELLLVIMGGVFVLETVSVMVQVASFRLTGKRVFRMAPLHHHFELKGWPESVVIVRFWIISLVLVLVALSTLKIR